MSETYRQGDRVKHQTKTDWGLGEVLKDPVDDKVEVIFEDLGPPSRKFKVSLAPLVKVHGEEGRSEYLTALVKRHLRPVSGRSGSRASTVISFDRAVKKFVRFFPGGFCDPRFKAEERNYKVEAHEQLVNALGREQLGAFVQSGSYAEISKLAQAAVNATNLISPYEKLWLKNGIQTPLRQQLFSVTLNAFLYGDTPMSTRFESFAKMLYDIGAAKWPVATYFSFLACPGEHIFLKPEVTKLAAEILGYDIRYEPRVNWATYERVLGLAAEIKARLSALGQEELVPNDMIDVQSFIWVVGNYEDE
jgi:hypothetical protein